MQRLTRPVDCGDSKLFQPGLVGLWKIVRGIWRDQCHVLAVHAQECRFVGAVIASADDPDTLVGHFEAVTDRAIAQQPALDRDIVDFGGYFRTIVDHARGEQDGSRCDRLIG